LGDRGIFGVEYHDNIVLVWCRSEEDRIGTFTIPFDQEMFEEFAESVEGKVVRQTIDYDLENHTIRVLDVID